MRELRGSIFLMVVQQEDGRGGKINRNETPFLRMDVISCHHAQKAETTERVFTFFYGKMGAVSNFAGAKLTLRGFFSM